MELAHDKLNFQLNVQKEVQGRSGGGGLHPLLGPPQCAVSALGF